MDESAKTEARNYLSAAGFFMIAAYFMLIELMVAGGSPDYTYMSIVGISLLLIGTLLIILRKRDMIAMLFMMMSFFITVIYFIQGFPTAVIGACFGGLILLSLLAMLTGRDKEKCLLIVIPLLMAVMAVVNMMSGIRLDIVSWILAIIALYFAFACASERISFPGSRLLTADEETDFKYSGSVLGYLLLASIGGAFSLFYALGNEELLSFETVTTLKLVSCVLMVYVSVLLFAVGKMRFTPVMFLMTAVTLIFSVYASGLMVITCGVLFIALGLCAVLRNESRILPGIMLILFGGTAFISIIAGGLLPSVPWLSVILNGVPCLIAVYLAFAVCSQDKLPLF